MAEADQCLHEMFVEIEWEGNDSLAVPLSQLQGLDIKKQSQQAIEDWHYWVARGYGF